MSTLLALETSTNACSAALLAGGKVYARSVVAPREHSERILGMVKELLDEAGIALGQLKGIAFGQGPGSFLGTRIACGVAQGLGFAQGVPLFPVSGLRALAQRAVEGFQVVDVIAAWDARMDSLYWGHYRLEGGRLTSVGGDRLCAPNEFVLPVASAILVGNAWAVYQASFDQALQNKIEKQPAAMTAFYPEAEYLLTEARFLLERSKEVEPADASPIYLREPC